MIDPTVEQPPPRSSRGDMWLKVMADMENRRLFGVSRYGTPVQPFNGRDPLVDAYQEALDLVVYLRQAIEERGRVFWQGVAEDLLNRIELSPEEAERVMAQTVRRNRAGLPNEPIPIQCVDCGGDLAEVGGHACPGQ